jgi:hypothetical protein
MAYVHTIDLDIAKDVFLVHSIDAAGKVIVRSSLTEPYRAGRSAPGGWHNAGANYRKSGHHATQRQRRRPSITANHEWNGGQNRLAKAKQYRALTSERQAKL